MSVDFELLWARITRMVSFAVGVGIMVYETVADHSDRPWLYAAAIGMMGLPIARAAESLIAHWSPAGAPGSQPITKAETAPPPPQTKPE